MPRTGARGGPQTRARILEVATGLFVERGYDAVTVAEIARAAGVSSVTVFNHFPRKEDLFLDRQDDAVELVRAAVRDRGPGVDVLASLQHATERLAEARHPLSGLDERSLPFFRTVAASPALIARAREIAAEIEEALADELDRDPAFDGDAALLAAFLVAGYATVLVATARRRLAGAAPEELLDDHRARVTRLFSALRGGVAG
ncbi:TetR/AcrR family transcriptional regulator [Pseudonocardia sp. CA-107938]|uniref:TetR/AcrR family transcriptional regulator n=1 Tax=Pseudonocardia sp. CA-107938 TaxID=3240021 RepID=UPI003D941D15